MTAIPLPQIARLAAELNLSVIRSNSHFYGRKAMHGIIALFLSRMCLADWCVGDGIAPPDRVTRFASVNQLAASLDLPLETTRRNVVEMVGLGHLVRLDDGLALPVAPPAAARTVAYLSALHDLYVRLIDDIARTGNFGFAPTGNRVPLVRDVLERALDIFLMPFDAWGGIDSNLAAKYLWVAVNCANIRHLTIDAELSNRHAFEPPDDSERRAVSVRSAAAAIEMSYATAWRQVPVLTALQLLTVGRHGLIVSRASLASETVRRRRQQSVGYLLRRTDELCRSGLDPARASERYITGRPPLVPFLQDRPGAAPTEGAMA
ncbi:MAG: hypothetical protein RL490_1043 [Pseudomonadota bacterium]|jgi:hypothetical protein